MIDQQRGETEGAAAATGGRRRGVAIKCKRRRLAGGGEEEEVPGRRSRSNNMYRASVQYIVHVLRCGQFGWGGGSEQKRQIAS